MTSPLTVAQVRRRRCIRCRRRGYATWHICADGNRPRVLCRRCDVALNRLVLKWAKFKDRRQLMKAYRRKVDASIQSIGRKKR